MMPVRKPSTLSPLNRALFATQVVMMWERLLPALFPYALLAFIVAVAAQWGLFVALSPLVHLAVLAAGLLVAIFASFRAIYRFRVPTFTERYARLALDNGLKPERLLAMRHESDQPRLRVGKAKAGIAQSDPFALRFVALAAAVLGILVLGPVSIERIGTGFSLLAGKDLGVVRLAQKAAD